MSKRWMKAALATVVAVLAPWRLVFAHEAYVLPHDFFWQNLDGPVSWHAFDALKNPSDLRLALVITGAIALALVINFLFRRTRAGRAVHVWPERFGRFGPLFIRISIAVAFFFSAKSFSFLGPELDLGRMPLAHGIQALLYICSVLIALGLFTELAAAGALIAFTVGFCVFGLYLLTYLNYLGEILVLLFFGTRTWSFDGKLFGKRSLFGLGRWEKYDTTIVRVFYGLALIYAAITVKLMHPELTIAVVNDWNLTQFHWLFPRDPLLVTLGAGLTEFAIGLFILIGFEMRLTVLVSLFYITLSLFYFREMVWPHLMLYGISLNLLVQPEVFTLDHFLDRANLRNIWKRPFLPHSH